MLSLPFLIRCIHSLSLHLLEHFTFISVDSMAFFFFVAFRIYGLQNSTKMWVFSMNIFFKSSNELKKNLKNNNNRCGFSGHWTIFALARKWYIKIDGKWWQKFSPTIWSYPKNWTKNKNNFLTGTVGAHKFNCMFERMKVLLSFLRKMNKKLLSLSL